MSGITPWRSACRTVNTVVADITSDSTLSKINAYDGRINYDLRRIEVEPEKYVQDYTLKVHLTPGSGVDAGTVEAVQAKAKVGSGWSAQSRVPDAQW